MKDIKQINAVLQRHSEVLDAIWQGKITFISDEIAKAVGDLKTIQAVMTDGEGNVRLAREYREYLERVLGQRGNYRSSMSIASDLVLLQASAEDAIDAYNRRDEEEYYRALSEASDIVWGLAGAIESEVLSFEEILHRGLGETGSTAARIRRLELYISQLKDMEESVDLLVSGKAREVLSDPCLRDLAREYGRMIGNKVGIISERVIRTSKRISDLLIADRDILMRTKRSRTMLRAMKNVGLVERAELLSLDAEPAVLPLFRFAPQVDPSDPDLEGLRETLGAKERPHQPRQARPQVQEAGEYSDEPAPTTESDRLNVEVAILSSGFEAALRCDVALSLRDWLEGSSYKEDITVPFRAILSSLLWDSSRFDVCFVPELSDHTTSVIHDVRVTRLPCEE